MKMPELLRRTASPMFLSITLCAFLACGCSASRHAEHARVSADSTTVSTSALLGRLSADSLSLDIDIVIDSPELIRQTAPVAAAMPIVRARSIRVHAAGRRTSVTAANAAILTDSAAVSHSSSASSTTTTASTGGFRMCLFLLLGAMLLIKIIIHLYRFLAKKS